jgi:hypothetical protein
MEPQRYPHSSRSSTDQATVIETGVERTTLYRLIKRFGLDEDQRLLETAAAVGVGS